MSIGFIALLLPGLLAVAICWRLLPLLMFNQRLRWLLQILLLAVGFAVGLVYISALAEATTAQALWALLAAVGGVHIPAAAILIIKRITHPERSFY